MGLRPLYIIVFLQRGDRLQTSESDVYRRQILTSKVGPRAVRVNAVYKYIATYSRHEPLPIANFNRHILS